MQKLIYFFELKLSSDNPFDPKSRPKLLMPGPKSYTLPLSFYQLSLNFNTIILIIEYSKILEFLSNCCLKICFEAFLDNKHSINISYLSSWEGHDNETIFSSMVFLCFVIDILSLFGLHKHQGHSLFQKCIFFLR